MLTRTCVLSPARRRSFTMIELLAVMAVIAILAALVIGGTRLAFRKGQEGAIRAKLNKMTLALDQYKRDWGYYPIWPLTATSTVYDLNYEMKAPAPSNTTYLDESTQPYRQGGSGSKPFQYRYPGTNNPQKYDLWSLGVDETANTTDDITNWKWN